MNADGSFPYAPPSAKLAKRLAQMAQLGVYNTSPVRIANIISYALILEGVPAPCSPTSSRTSNPTSSNCNPGGKVLNNYALSPPLMLIKEAPGAHERLAEGPIRAWLEDRCHASILCVTPPADDTTASAALHLLLGLDSDSVLTECLWAAAAATTGSGASGRGPGPGPAGPPCFALWCGEQGGGCAGASDGDDAGGGGAGTRSGADGWRNLLAEAAAEAGTTSTATPAAPAPAAGPAGAGGAVRVYSGGGFRLAGPNLKLRPPPPLQGQGAAAAAGTAASAIVAGGPVCVSTAQEAVAVLHAAFSRSSLWRRREDSISTGAAAAAQRGPLPSGIPAAGGGGPVDGVPPLLEPAVPRLHAATLFVRLGVVRAGLQDAAAAAGSTRAAAPTASGHGGDGSGGDCWTTFDLVFVGGDGGFGSGAGQTPLATKTGSDPPRGPHSGCVRALLSELLERQPDESGVPRPLRGCGGRPGCALCRRLAPLLAGNLAPHLLAVLPDAAGGMTPPAAAAVAVAAGERELQQQLVLEVLQLLSAAQAIRTVVTRTDPPPALYANGLKDGCSADSRGGAAFPQRLGSTAVRSSSTNNSSGGGPCQWVDGSRQLAALLCDQYARERRRAEAAQRRQGAEAAAAAAAAVTVATHAAQSAGDFTTVGSGRPRTEEGARDVVEEAQVPMTQSPSQRAPSEPRGVVPSCVRPVADSGVHQGTGNAAGRSAEPRAHAGRGAEEAAEALEAARGAKHGNQAQESSGPHASPPGSLVRLQRRLESLQRVNARRGSQVPGLDLPALVTPQEAASGGAHGTGSPSENGASGASAAAAYVMPAAAGDVAAAASGAEAEAAAAALRSLREQFDRLYFGLVPDGVRGEGYSVQAATSAGPPPPLVPPQQLQQQQVRDPPPGAVDGQGRKAQGPVSRSPAKASGVTPPATSAVPRGPVTNALLACLPPQARPPQLQQQPRLRPSPAAAHSTAAASAVGWSKDGVTTQTQAGPSTVPNLPLHPQHANHRNDSAGKPHTSSPRSDRQHRTPWGGDTNLAATGGDAGMWGTRTATASAVAAPAAQQQGSASGLRNALMAGHAVQAGPGVAAGHDRSRDSNGRRRAPGFEDWSPALGLAGLVFPASSPKDTAAGLTTEHSWRQGVHHSPGGRGQRHGSEAHARERRVQFGCKHGSEGERQQVCVGPASFSPLGETSRASGSDSDPDCHGHWRHGSGKAARHRHRGSGVGPMSTDSGDSDDDDAPPGGGIEDGSDVGDSEGRPMGRSGGAVASGSSVEGYARLHRHSRATASSRRRPDDARSGSRRPASQGQLEGQESETVQQQHREQDRRLESPSVMYGRRWESRARRWGAGPAARRSPEAARRGARGDGAGGRVRSRGAGGYGGHDSSSSSGSGSTSSSSGDRDSGSGGSRDSEGSSRGGAGRGNRSSRDGAGSEADGSFPAHSEEADGDNSDGNGASGTPTVSSNATSHPNCQPQPQFHRSATPATGPIPSAAVADADGKLRLRNNALLGVLERAAAGSEALQGRLYGAQLEVLELRAALEVQRAEHAAELAALRRHMRRAAEAAAATEDGRGGRGGGGGGGAAESGGPPSGIPAATALEALLGAYEEQIQSLQKQVADLVAGEAELAQQMAQQELAAAAERAARRRRRREQAQRRPRRHSFGGELGRALARRAAQGCGGSSTSTEEGGDSDDGREWLLPLPSDTEVLRRAGCKVISGSARGGAGAADAAWLRGRQEFGSLRAALRRSAAREAELRETLTEAQRRQRAALLAARLAAGEGAARRRAEQQVAELRKELAAARDSGAAAAAGRDAAWRECQRLRTEAGVLGAQLEEMRRAAEEYAKLLDASNGWIRTAAALPPPPLSTAMTAAPPEPHLVQAYGRLHV